MASDQRASSERLEARERLRSAQSGAAEARARLAEADERARAAAATTAKREAALGSELDAARRERESLARDREALAGQLRALRAAQSEAVASIAAAEEAKTRALAQAAAAEAEAEAAAVLAAEARRRGGVAPTASGETSTEGSPLPLSPSRVILEGLRERLERARLAVRNDGTGGADSARSMALTEPSPEQEERLTRLEALVMSHLSGDQCRFCTERATRLRETAEEAEADVEGDDSPAWLRQATFDLLGSPAGKEPPLLAGRPSGSHTLQEAQPRDLRVCPPMPPVVSSRVASSQASAAETRPASLYDAVSSSHRDSSQRGGESIDSPQDLAACPRDLAVFSRDLATFPVAASSHAEVAAVSPGLQPPGPSARVQQMHAKLCAAVAMRATRWSLTARYNALARWRALLDDSCRVAERGESCDESSAGRGEAGRSEAREGRRARSDQAFWLDSREAHPCGSAIERSAPTAAWPASASSPALPLHSPRPQPTPPPPPPFTPPPPPPELTRASAAGAWYESSTGSREPGHGRQRRGASSGARCGGARCAEAHPSGTGTRAEALERQLAAALSDGSARLDARSSRASDQ